jgi:hypothetical protein
MKTFISLGIEEGELPTVVVFQAKNEEEAVLAVAEEILGPDEIEDFVQNGEPGDEISDFVHIFMLDDYPVIIEEVKTLNKGGYEGAKAIDMGYWYSSDVLPLLDKKYPKKK